MQYNMTGNASHYACQLPSKQLCKALNDGVDPGAAGDEWSWASHTVLESSSGPPQPPKTSGMASYQVHKLLVRPCQSQGSFRKISANESWS